MGLRFGRYETLQPVAAGGMAKVYRGRAVADGGFERIVAIKVMHSHLADDPEFVDMFLDEARLAAKIRHPNVVATHDVRRSPVGTFLVMDYVDGFDLAVLQRAVRSRGTKLPIEITFRIVLDVLAGLSAAHELVEPDGTPLNLVHRDVSPQNILVDKTTGTVHLTDFGVAHARERLSNTQAGALKGKLGYLSPEHARDGSVDRRSDVYSAGVLLWEALTGQQMFAGRARVRVLADILKGNVRTPHEVDAGIPEAISMACMRALALEPADRFQTAREFADGLRLAALSAGLEAADSEAVREFVIASGAEEYSRIAKRHLSEEEVTIADRTLSEPAAAPRGDAQAPAAHRLWYAAAGLFAAATLGAYLLWSIPAVVPSVPSADETAPRMQPLVIETTSLPEAEQLAKSPSDLSTPATDDRGIEGKPRTRPRKGMYHPKGL